MNKPNIAELKLPEDMPNPRYFITHCVESGHDPHPDLRFVWQRADVLYHFCRRCGLAYIEYKWPLKEPEPSWPSSPLFVADLEESTSAASIEPGIR